MKKIRLDGYVGIDITSEKFAEELKSAAGDDLEITLNTAGGNVFHAFDIYQQIKEYTGQVTIKAGGIVASAGTIIYAGADKRISDQITSFMIHNAHAFVDGDYKDMEAASEMLRRMNKHMAVQYSATTGKSEKEIFAMMDAETWFFGNEIVEAGFAHELADGKPAVEINRLVALSSARASFEECNKKFQENPLRECDLAKIPAVAASIDANKIPHKKETKVDRNEALNFIKADMKPAEIAAAFNLELADKAKESEIVAVKAENESLKKVISDNAETLRLAKIQALYPGKDSPMAAYLTKITAGMAEKEVQAVIDGLKDDPVAKVILAKMADQDSGFNIIEVGAAADAKKEPVANIGGTVVM